MRGILGIAALLLVLAVVGWLAKSQLSASKVLLPDTPTHAPANAAAPALTPHQASEQAQQQIKRSVEGSLQQARPTQEDAP